MFRVVFLALCSMFVAVSPKAVSADFIVNGGFETGDFSGWTLIGDPSNSFVETSFPHIGIFNASLGETGQLGSLSQNITTSIGTPYKLSFWLAGGGDPPIEFMASIDNAVVLDLINPMADGQYHYYEYQFIASTSSTNIEFKFRDDAFFLALDDVSVVNASTVPEPSSLLLLSTGTVGIAVFALLRRWRFHSRHARS